MRCERIIGARLVWVSIRKMKKVDLSGLYGMEASECGQPAVAVRGGKMLCIKHWLSEDDDE